MKRSLNLSRPPGPLLQKIENNIDLASCSYLNLLSKRFLNTLMQFWLKQPLHVTLQAEEIFIDPFVHP